MATSFPEKPDTRAKTARPESVGPHGVTIEQEDPANKGIDPQKGYQPKPGDNNNFTPATGGPKGPVNIGVKGGAEDEDAKPRPKQPGEGGGKATASGSMPEE